MVMSASNLRRYITPLLSSKVPPNLSTIRIGTKSLAWWPHRYLSSLDGRDILNLFTEITASGLHLSIQAHFCHIRELQNPFVQEAMRMIRMTGAQIRCQSPLIQHVNNSSQVWRDMWSLQTRLGAVPYYMFVERDTGARNYFSVPLTQALKIFNEAYSSVSGLARTARGPSMSASPGKVGIMGEEDIEGKRVFVLKFLQARNPKWTHRVFFAEYDPKAVWFDDLKPAFGGTRFFFEEEYHRMSSQAHLLSSGQMLSI